jgi:hypothetical protein
LETGRGCSENDAECAKYRDDEGKLKGSGGDVHRPRHLLQLLLHCICGKPFYTNGGKQQYLVCSGFLKGKCERKTRLPRKLAEKKIAEVLRARLFQSPEWLQMVYEQGQLAWEHLQRENPDEGKELEDGIRKTDQAIEKLLDLAEASPKNPIILQRIEKRQDEKAAFERRLEELRRERDRQPEPVGRDDVTRALAHWYASRGLDVPDGREERKQFRLLREAQEGKKSA